MFARRIFLQPASRPGSAFVQRLDCSAEDARINVLKLVLGLLILPWLVGCTSVSSVLLHRGEQNTHWEREPHLHGIPITLKVPTHVRVDVLAKHLFLLDAGTVRRSEAPFAIREVTYNFIETEKIFTVDVKRPAAGTLNATVDLDPESQYFQQISENLSDETIAQVGNLIAAIAPGGLIGAPTNAGRSTTPLDEHVKEVSSVIASQVFEVDAPDFETQIMDFLNRHLNGCHDCGVLPVDALPPKMLWGNGSYPSHPSRGGSQFEGTPDIGAAIEGANWEVLDAAAMPSRVPTQPIPTERLQPKD